MRSLLPFPDGAPGYTAFLAVLAYTLLIVTYYFTGGHIAMKIAVAAVAVAAAVGSLRLRLPAPALILLLFVVVGWLSISRAMDAALANLLFEELWKIGIIYFTVLQVLNNLPRVIQFTSMCFAAFVLFPVRGAIINYAGGYRVEGRAVWNYVYENSNDLALLVLLGGALGLAVVHAVSDKRLRLLAWLGLTACFVVVILSGSRGTIVALGASSAIYLLRHIKRPRIWAMALVLALATWFAAPETLRERLATLARPTDTEAARSADSGSAKERMAIWETSRQIIADNALLGVGFGMYPLAHRYYNTGSQDLISAHGPEAAVFRPGASLQDAHNTYVTIWAELGVVGLMIYVAFVGATLYRVRVVRRRWKNSLPHLCRALEILELSLVCFLVAAIWGTFVRLAFSYVYFALALSWSLEVDRRARQSARGRFVPTPARTPRYITAAPGRPSPQRQ